MSVLYYCFDHIGMLSFGNMERMASSGHYLECSVMDSGITASMAAAVSSRRSHVQALHNYRVFMNNNKEFRAW